MLNISTVKKRVLITGAAGRLGQILAAAWEERYELLLIDICQPVKSLTSMDVTLSSVTDYEQMRRLCSQVDVVIHLAISGNLNDDWDKVAPVNINGTRSVYQAASESGVQRVVFASTINVDLAPQNPYGASKYWGEILAKRYVDNTSLSILCLRLGLVIGQDDPFISIGRKELGYVLTYDDLIRLFTASIESAPNVRYGVFHGISANRFPYFDIKNTRIVLGYEPQSDAYQIARRNLFTIKGFYKWFMRITRSIWSMLKKRWN